MANRKIDYDRGVIIMTHPGGGFDVFMYVDTPGVFLNAFGTEIDASLAKEAGFDVEKLVREKVKRERIAQAAQAIEEELSLAEKEGERTVVMEREGFKVISIGLGRHFVEDPDGNKLTLHALPEIQAKALLEKIAPKKAVPVVTGVKKENKDG